MKILVTGGLGFIGSNFIRYVLGKYPDYQIVNLDKVTYAGNPENLRDIEDNPRYKFVKGDICDEETVDKIVKDKIEAIINFAAQTHVDRSIIEPADFIKTNVYGTYVLLEAAKEHKVSKVLQISTDEVYGSIEKGSFTEESPLRPNSPYAASKASADLLVRSYSVTYGLPVLITRSSNNFGPYQYPEKLIPLFITNALEEKRLPLYGDGKNIRDWLYVLDNCEVIDFILHRGEGGQVYNIGGGEELTNIELTLLILRQLRKGDGLIEFVKDRPGHDRRYALDCTKINRLGWRPGYNFASALSETIKWYQENRRWWEKLKGRF